MKKIVLKAEIDCEKCKREKFEAIAGVKGVHSVTIDGEENKITVIGDVDPARLTMELRRLGPAEIVSVGPAKDDKKELVKIVNVVPAKDDKNEKKDLTVKNEDSKSEPKMMTEAAERNIYMWPTPAPTYNMPGKWKPVQEWLKKRLAINNHLTMPRDVMDIVKLFGKIAKRI